MKVGYYKVIKQKKPFGVVFYFILFFIFSCFVFYFLVVLFFIFSCFVFICLAWLCVFVVFVVCCGE